MNLSQPIINVNKTYLPPLSEYIKYLEEIWISNLITNNGPLLQELEAKLREFLDVKHLIVVSSGTLALQIAIKALNLQGEIITTPFSYVASTSSIVWEGCTPVFVDIDPDTLNLNPDLIEAAITPHTCAILAVHVYGNPCDVVQIQAIADRHGLRVIYDAAHAFGVQYRQRSLFVHGDISTASFHATKIFHMTEGGALVTNDDEIAHRIAYMRNFGHRGEEQFWGLGVNGKSSELHAAMGLCVLPKVPELISQRKHIAALYNDLLQGCNVTRPNRLAEINHNYLYYPVLFPSEGKMLSTFSALNTQGVYPRRYFYPTLNQLPYGAQVHMPVAQDASERILCLPIYPDLADEDVARICTIIKSV